MTLLLISCFLAVFIPSYAVITQLYVKKHIIQIRLSNIERETEIREEVEINKPVYVRVIQPLFNRISKMIMQITPKEFIVKLEHKITAAGKPYNLDVRKWFNIMLVLIVILPVLTAIMGFSLPLSLKNTVLYILFEAGTGMMLPNFILSRAIAKRQKQVLKTLPDLLDLLTVSVEAGLGFDSALAKVIEKMEGPLSQEFAIVLQEIKVGKPKKDALKDMSERLNTQDFTAFANSVIQAEKLGISIGNVLRIQADQMREKRKQRAQEKAMKAPIKMLIPMVLFIFPVIFAVLLGPIVLNVIKVFAK